MPGHVQYHDDWTTISFGWRAFARRLRPSICRAVASTYLVIEHLSIGGSLGYVSLDANDAPDISMFEISPRVGYLYSFGRASGHLASGRLYVPHRTSVNNGPDENGLALTLECPFTFSRRVALCVSRWAQLRYRHVRLARVHASTIQDKGDRTYRTFGLSAGLLGWLVAAPLALFSSSGGLLYHLRALRYSTRLWAPFRSALATGSPSTCRGRGAGAGRAERGHCLPLLELSRFRRSASARARASRWPAARASSWQCSRRARTPRSAARCFRGRGGSTRFWRAPKPRRCCLQRAGALKFELTSEQRPDQQTRRSSSRVSNCQDDARAAGSEKLGSSTSIAESVRARAAADSGPRSPYQPPAPRRRQVLGEPVAEGTAKRSPKRVLYVAPADGRAGRRRTRTAPTARLTASQKARR